MSKTPTHPPLPYFLDEGYECQPGIYTEPSIYVPGQCICQLTLFRNGNSNATRRERVVETSRFIWRACNSHYELLASLQNALDRGYFDPHLDDSEAERDDKEAARAAISRAESQP